MNADQLNKARNPLLPAAMAAIQRAAKRARDEAIRSHTGIIIAHAGKIERIVANEVRETKAGYSTASPSEGNEDQS